ncbi:protein transport protein HofC [Enterobacillus tribolii]|uniref:Protein transport protein HofC n=1 Tax=Enterobacillus tribolii TaxID=1487935 RepID=A0A370R1R4_9GAMM|nr:protein transport protein HofC [Enterobacillus tribolii]MBW7983032.1 type IV pilin biogenesis protein [Enterobacillus tribolii]RDK95864.1 protein transport protein HofC [Enterobacillus tribolii]
MNWFIFRWQALTEHAEPRQGDMLAHDAAQVLQTLLAHDLHPLRIRKHQRLGTNRWSPQEQIHCLEQLATLLHAGMPLVRSLQMLADDHPQRHWRCLLTQLTARVEQGNTLSEALEEYGDIFPPVYAKTIATAELTGNMALCCQALAHQQKQHYLLKQRLRKAMRYPLIVCITALLVTLMMLIWVLPQFASLYQSFNAPLPWFTRFLLKLSDIIGRTAPVVAPSLLLAGVFIRRHWHRTPSWRQRWQKFLIRIPLLRGLITATHLGQLFHTLNMTQTAGLPLLSGLDNAARSVDHILFRQAMTNIIGELNQGESFSIAVSRQPMLPALCFQLIRVGEESGALDTLLEKLAEHYQQQAQQIGDALAQTTEPLMMAVIGIIVGSLVMAMYLPIFQLGSVLG